MGARNRGERAETPVRTLLNELRVGDRKKLSHADRVRCVDQLWAEGASVAEMAQLLDVSERTITRLRNQIREHTAVEVSTGLRIRLLADLVRQSDVSVSQLRRLARDSSANIAERASLQVQIVDVLLKTIQACDALGAFPNDSRGVIGDSSGQATTTRFQLLHLAAVAESHETSPSLRGHIHNLLDELGDEKGVQ